MGRLVFVDHGAGISSGHAGKALVNSFRYTPGATGGLCLWTSFSPGSAGYEFTPPDFLKVSFRLRWKTKILPDLFLAPPVFEKGTLRRKGSGRGEGKALGVNWGWASRIFYLTPFLSFFHNRFGNGEGRF